MPAVTLTTDWGLTDHYVAALKGELLSLVPSVQLIDITHQVPPFDVMKAAFIFKNAYYYFPSGTIHLVCVASHASTNLGWMVIEDNDCFIICKNDGFFTMVAGRQPHKAIFIDQSDLLSAAEEKSFLVTLINDLVVSKKTEALGTKVETIHQRNFFKPSQEDNLIRGTIVHIDIYGNAITNIEKTFFDHAIGDRKFEIDFPRRDLAIRTISRNYRDVSPGKLLVLFNASGYLEIAQNQGDASGLYGLEYGDQIRVSIL
jgi:S-adenosylmethionine hydrolase